MRTLTLRFLVFTIVATLGVGTRTVAADAGKRRLNMADSMLRMMDSMGMFGESAQKALPMDEGGVGQAWESFRSGIGSPAWSTGVPSKNAPQLSHPGYPDTRGAAHPAARLQGRWISSSGERLMIHRDRFRLLAGSRSGIDGLVHVRGNMLALYSPRYDRTWVYEFAEHQGRLALRDTDGRLYLYRRPISR